MTVVKSKEIVFRVPVFFRKKKIKNKTKQKQKQKKNNKKTEDFPNT